jgi:hypothetical protein
MGFSCTEELERPAEWLGSLADGSLFRALVKESKGLSVAAYRLARARLRVLTVPMSVPTLREVAVAASALAEACETPVPSYATLLDECTDAGCVVIAPI